VERAVFMSVLHRLFSPGSDRQADRWRGDYGIQGAEELQLHHLYRAMRWLGSVREQVEQQLFARRRDLFTAADLVFFDTTSIYFEGAGGQRLGQYGHSKDHRPDRVQMIVGAVVDSAGKPMCAPMWPGNRTDVTTLLPLVHDLRTRFGIERVSIVADRGMISAKTIEALQARKPPMGYILGARLRNSKEVRDVVLSRGGRYKTVRGNLRVKEVRVGDRRYVVCLNPEEAERDAATRTAMVEALQHKLPHGASGLIGNRGYKRFLRVNRGAVQLDGDKIQQDARYDGKFVLRTNLDLPADQVALRYKELWQVERIFRDAKSLLETRPVFHHWDATICGHVFVSFLALVLLRELQARQQTRGLEAEWADIRRDLDALEEVEVVDGGDTYWLRTPLKPGATAAFRAAGVAIPPTVREG
jgi:transposase